MANNGGLGPSTFASSLLRQLGITPTPSNVRAIVGWEKAEGGHWNNSAKYNPLNTTEPAPGSSTFQSVGVGSAPIRIYTSWAQGVDATARTLRLPAYRGILASLRANNPNAVANAIGASPWGTSAGLVRSTIGASPVPSTVPAVSASAAPGAAGTQTRTSPGTDNSAARRDLIAQFMSQGGPSNDNALIGLASGLQNAQDTPSRTVTASGPVKPTPLGPSSNAPPSVQQIVARANAINAKHYNYEWGGGHNPGGVPSHGVGHGSGPGVGFDCSGVVSRIFGINPRVASQFESWGQAGKGRYVTVYANGTHTFMEINGHFFGTSASNPGGGAGWIPRGVMSPGYLKGFTIRHPNGL